MDINELINKAKKGDLAAFGLVYDMFYQRIFRYIRLKVQDKQEAEDILQEVFIKAYKGLGRLDEENLNFSAWLYRITSNTINDYFRKKYRMPEILEINENFDTPGSVSVEKEMEVKSDLEIVKGAFTKLPPIYRQVLELRFIRDFSLDEIAKILNKSNLSVRLLQYRALKKVQVILETSSAKDRAAAANKIKHLKGET